jgi:hypothetical protein
MQRDPITQLTDSEMLSFNTIRLVTKDQDGKKGFATGFFYRFRRSDNQIIDSLVTNRHVLSEARSIRFRLNPIGAGHGPDLTSTLKTHLFPCDFAKSTNFILFSSVVFPSIPAKSKNLSNLPWYFFLV